MNNAGDLVEGEGCFPRARAGVDQHRGEGAGQAPHHGQGSNNLR